MVRSFSVLSFLVTGDVITSQRRITRSQTRCGAATKAAQVAASGGLVYLEVAETDKGADDNTYRYYRAAQTRTTAPDHEAAFELSPTWKSLTEAQQMVDLWVRAFPRNTEQAWKMRPALVSKEVFFGRTSELQIRRQFITGSSDILRKLPTELKEMIWYWAEGSRGLT